MNLENLMIAMEAFGPVTQQDFDKAVQKLFKSTMRDFNKIEYSKSPNGNYTGSRIGGIPYFEVGNPISKEVSNQTKWMIMIAQINLSELKVRCGLPNKGILQFWEEGDKGIYSYGGYQRVIYFPNITTDTSLHLEAIQENKEIVDKHINLIKRRESSLVASTKEEYINGHMMSFSKITEPVLNFMGIQDNPEIKKLRRNCIENWQDYLDNAVRKYAPKHSFKNGFVQPTSDNVGGYFSSMNKISESEYSEYLSQTILLQLDSRHTSHFSYGDAETIAWTLPSQSELQQKQFDKAVMIYGGD